MAGGTGSRLWPLSRTLYPKQFMALNGEDSMLQASLRRLKGLETSPAIIITNEEHRFIVAEQVTLRSRKAGEPQTSSSTDTGKWSDAVKSAD